MPRTKTQTIMRADAPQECGRRHASRYGGMTGEERQLGYFRSVLNRTAK